MKNFTDSGLPIIQKETVDSIFGRYCDRKTNSETDWGEFLQKTKVELIEENPELVNYIEGIVGQHPPEMHQSCFEVIMGLYVILNAQAESYKLEKILE